jgi:hypothetical protein
MRALSEPMTCSFSGSLAMTKVTRMFLVRDLQVEVVAGEHPVCLRGNKTGGIDTERTDHTFQLVIGLILVGTLERCHEGHYLRVLHEYVENFTVAAAEERQHMRHVAVLTRDRVRLHLISLVVLIPAAVDAYLLLVEVEIAEAVQVYEHIVGIGGDIVAVLIDEVKNHIAFGIKRLVVTPATDDEA